MRYTYLQYNILNVVHVSTIRYQKQTPCTKLQCTVITCSSMLVQFDYNFGFGAAGGHFQHNNWGWRVNLFSLQYVYIYHPKERHMVK